MATSGHPKKGHHVINKGVLKLIKKIIDRFLEVCNLPQFRSLQEHLQDTNARVHRAYTQPLDPETKHRIEMVLVYYGQLSEHHGSCEEYGEAVEELFRATLEYMRKLFNAETDEDCARFRQSVENMTERCYVDEMARNEYLKQERRRGQQLLDSTLQEVANMFETLKTELERWVRELKDAADAWEKKTKYK